jgi:hypothetical protein
MKSDHKPQRHTLGRSGVFLLPSLKMKLKSPREIPFEQELHHFLMQTFQGYTVTAGNISGYWKTPDGHDQYGEHREYKVGFGSEEKIQELEEFLAKLGREIEEDCIYFETGEQAWLIYSKNIQKDTS